MNGDKLRSYLPQGTSLPALYSDGGTKENISEREIFYKVLLELRKDVNDLKKMAVEGNLAPAQYPSQQMPVTEDIDEKKEPMLLNIDHNGHDEVSGAEEVQDVSHIAEDDSLSIEKKEKELIMRALRKNNNKRKYAARDLGISERTLYRKIKQYELEE